MKKSLTPEMRKEMLFNSREKFDFNDLDQQIFYMFYYICDNEERLANAFIQKTTK